MNTQFYQIVPKPVIIQKILKSFSVKIVDFVFNKGVVLLVTFYDATGVIHDTQYLELSGDEYNAWSNDDNYVIDYVCQKYGMDLES